MPQCLISSTYSNKNNLNERFAVCAMEYLADKHPVSNYLIQVR